MRIPARKKGYSPRFDHNDANGNLQRLDTKPGVFSDLWDDSPDEVDCLQYEVAHTHTEIAVNSPHKMNIFQSSRSPMPAQYQRFIHGCCKRHVGMYVCNS